MKMARWFGNAAWRRTGLSAESTHLGEIDDRQPAAAAHHLQLPRRHAFAEHWVGSTHLQQVVSGVEVAVGRVKCACQLHQKRLTHCTTLTGMHAPGNKCISWLACGSNASSSAAVMSLMAGRWLAAMITTVPRRNSSRARGSMPAGCGAGQGRQAHQSGSSSCLGHQHRWLHRSAACQLGSRRLLLTEDDVSAAVVNKQHRPLVGVAAQHSMAA